MVGTEIWMRTRFGYRLDRGWSEVIGAHWDRAAVLDASMAVPGLTLQHSEWQSEHKVSWFIDGDDPEARVASLEALLEHRGLRALLVHSGGHLLDALPIESGKGSATAFLARRLGSPAVVTAGDSGNDLDMMRPELGFRSIVVGNGDPDVRSIEADHVYLAEAPYADGIAEGLRHWCWLDP
jgi:hydroxymethylpyrimidine pyrophosphatase-like HAD family hydrolase